MPYSDRARQREYQNTWMKARRLAWIATQGPCVKCGSTTELEADHVDPALKISHRIWSFSPAKRHAELAKCQVLCYECHKKKTAVEQTKPLVHGTYNAYNQKGCRCATCKDWNRDRMRDWRASRAA